MRRARKWEGNNKNIPTKTIYYVFSLYLQNRTKTLLDMALIKCEECGQMVSDKASACPHCGHTIKRTNNTLKWLFGILAALVVLGGAALYAWQSGMFNKSVPIEDRVAIDSVPTMIAPVIKLSGEGYFSIDDCPTSYEGLEIIKREGEFGLASIYIIRNGHLLRLFRFTDDRNIDRDEIHFLDANFDGYVDFFVGPAQDRNYSALFLWDTKQSNFVRGYEDGDPIFNGDYLFHPASQTVFFTGSGSWSSNHAVRLSWQNFDLRSEESLTSEMLKCRLDEDQPAKYVIRKGGLSGKVIFSTNDPDEIPAPWKGWARIPSREEAKQYEEEDAYFGYD